MADISKNDETTIQVIAIYAGGQQTFIQISCRVCLVNIFLSMSENYFDYLGHST